MTIDSDAPFQALSRLHVPQFSSLDDVFPSRLIIWRTENFSAARIVPAPKMILLIRKYDTQTTQKNPLEEYMSFMYQMAYGYHFSHSNARITAIFSFTPSSRACPVGVQSLPWKRGGSALRSSTTTYCGIFLWSREH